MAYLKWQIISRGTTRACSYTKQDMLAALSRSGCEVTNDPSTPSFVLIATRHLTDDEDARAVRDDVSRQIRNVHRRAGIRFLGLVE